MVDEMSPRISPIPEKKDRTMTFASCLEKLMLGERCRRLGWENEEIYVTIQNEHVMIFKTDDKKLHPLIVSTGDIVGIDWIVVGKSENLS